MTQGVIYVNLCYTAPQLMSKRARSATVANLSRRLGYFDPLGRNSL